MGWPLEDYGLVKTNGPIDLKITVQIFPDSARRNLLIKSSGLTDKHDMSIQLTDISGRVVFIEKLNVFIDQQTRIPMPDRLAAGVYFASVFSGNNLLATQKISW